jgi:tetratricopeptide (TPR) repeat protein
MATLPEAVNIARDHHNNGRFRAAETIYRRILDQVPNHTQTQLFLGTLYVQTGQYEQAINLINKAMAVLGERADMLLNIGESHRRLDQLPQAIDCFKKAIALNPDMGEAHTNLSLAYIQQEDFKNAIVAATRATELRPDNATAFSALGYAQRSAGLLDESLVTFNRALELDPASPDAAYHLTAAKKFKSDDPLLVKFETALERPGLSQPQLVSLHFALAKAYDDAKEYDHAFEHYRQGNRARRSSVPYERKYQQHLTDSFINFFTPQYMTDHKHWGHDSEKPIFIIGLPRSGTSLVEQILSSHPKVEGAGELKAMGDLVNEVPGQFNPPVGIPQCLGRMSDAQAKSMAERYLKALTAHGPDAERITDKHTINYQLVPLIRVLFPKAKFIHIRRDAKDTCLSCYFQMFREGQPFSYDLADAAHYYALYVRMMKQWIGELGIEMLDVQYDKLVGDVEGVSRDMVKWCGLKWDKQCLKFYESKRPVQTASVWQVREPIYTRSLGRAQRYKRHIQVLEDALERELAAIEAAAPAAVATS